MKIRHPAVRKLAGLGLSWVLRRWINTISFKFRNLSPTDLEPRQDNPAGPFLVAFWHQDVAVMTARYAGPHMRPLISEHADGQLINEAGRHLRMKAVMGSTTRGAVRAVRQMVNHKGPVNLVITPDGPKGPKFEVQSGVVYLASRGGLPILPIGYGYGKAWRLPTWDRMVIPWPGSEVYCVGGVPIHVPPDAGREELEVYRMRVQEAMNHARAVAEWLALQSRERSVAGGKRSDANLHQAGTRETQPEQIFTDQGHFRGSPKIGTPVVV